MKIVKLSSEKDTQQSMSRYTSANYYFSPEMSLVLEQVSNGGPQVFFTKCYFGLAADHADGVSSVKSAECSSFLAKKS